MLKHITEIPVKFSEVDSLRIVWHGHYVRYCEDAREAFGLHYGLHYLQVFEHGFVTPIVDLQLSYKRPLKYGDIACVQTEFVPTEAAKIIFQYTIFDKFTQEQVATAKTVQVFLDATHFTLVLNNPEFFKAWKAKVLQP